MWSLSRGEPVAIVDEPEKVDDVSFSPHDERWAARSGTVLQLQQLPSVVVGPPIDLEPTLIGLSLDEVAASADGRILAATEASGGHLVEGSGRVRVWDRRSGRELRLTCAGHAMALDLTPDGSMLATGATDGHVQIWATATGEESIRLQPPVIDNMSHVALRADGRRVAARGASGRVTAWELPGGRLLADFEVGGWEGNRLGPIAWARDRDLLAVADVHGVLVKDIATDRVKAYTDPTGKEPQGVAISPDGGRLAAAGYDGLAVWDGATGECLHRFPVNSYYDAPLALSDDGRYVALADPGKVQVWDVTSGEEVGRALFPRANHVHLAAGQRLVVVSRADVRAFPVWPEDLLAEACRNVRPALSPEEWLTYMGSQPRRPTCPME